MEGGQRGSQSWSAHGRVSKGAAYLLYKRKSLCLLCEAGLHCDSPQRRTSSLPASLAISLSQGSRNAYGTPSLLIHTALLCPCPPDTPFTVPRSTADGNEETNLTAIHPSTCSQPSAFIQQTFSMLRPCAGCRGCENEQHTSPALKSSCTQSLCASLTRSYPAPTSPCRTARLSILSLVKPAVSFGNGSD